MTAEAAALDLHLQLVSVWKTAGGVRKASEP